jgi:MoxR-like ATPase
MSTTTVASSPIGVLVTRLTDLERDLNQTLFEREDAIRCALVALLARQHLVLLGPPGTGKSQLVLELAQRINPPAGGGLTTFIWLLTRFTTPEEMFGPISVQGLKKDVYQRILTHKLPEAQLAFLDEIFKANSAVLNALLTILNERAFDNGPTRITVPLISLFGASNEMPQGEDLAALWDRFALRVMVEYTSDAGFARILRIGSAPPAAPVTLSQTDLLALQAATAAVTIPASVIEALTNLRKELAGKGITASDRRWRQCLILLQAHALIEGRQAVEEDDLAILKHALWTNPEQRQDIGRIAAKMANPLNARAVELFDQAETVYRAAMDAQANGALDDQAKMQAAIEAATKLKTITGQVKKLYDQAQTQGRNPARILKIGEQLKSMREQVAQLVL